MKNKFHKIITAITTFGATGLISIPAFAEDCTDICNCSTASEEIKAASGCGGTIASFEDTLMGIINGVLGILAVVAVIVIIIGGVQYMVSAGDPNKTKKAKDTILYACIGLVIIGLAAIIVNFVIGLIAQ